MITGVKNGVSLFLDSNLRKCLKIYAQPLVNDRTLEIPIEELEKFLRIVGASFKWVDIEDNAPNLKLKPPCV